MINKEHIDPQSQTRISLILLVNYTAPDDSLLTIDVAGSQDSFSFLAKSEKEMVIDEQRGDVNTQEEEFEKLLKKLKSQINSRQIDSISRQKSLLSNP